MCSYGYACHHPPRRPGRLLRLGRPARRPQPARPTGDRGRRRRVGGLLRGARLRSALGDGRRTRPATVPRCRDRLPAVLGLRRGREGRGRDLRRDRPRGGATLDRRGLPRRERPRADLRHPAGDRRVPAARGARAGGPGHLGRCGTDQEPGQGGQRRVQARRAARGGSRARARVPAPARSRAPLGCRSHDGGAAARARPAHGRPAGPARTVHLGRHSRALRWGSPPRHGPRARPAPGSHAPRARLFRCSERARSLRGLPRGGGRGARGSGGPGHPPDAGRRAQGTDRGIAPALRRLRAREPVAHPGPRHGRDRARADHRSGAARWGAGDDRAPGPDADRRGRLQPGPHRRRRPARAAAVGHRARPGRRRPRRRAPSLRPSCADPGDPPGSRPPTSPPGFSPARSRTCEDTRARPSPRWPPRSAGP